MSVRLATAALIAATAFVAPAGAAERPVVVELFTSQGCSSCPPANANLIRLAGRRDVLALSFAVTYWDRLGWKDVFGKPEFTQRQYDYEPPLGQNGPFTPQMVVNGRRSAVGQNLSEIESMISQAGGDGGPEVSIASGKVSVGAGKAPGGGADVWLVRYEPGVQQVAVKRGENSGRTLAHANVVRDLRRIGGWDGGAATFPLPGGGKGGTAVLVQAKNGGPILGAATN